MSAYRSIKAWKAARHAKERNYDDAVAIDQPAIELSSETVTITFDEMVTLLDPEPDPEVESMPTSEITVYPDVGSSWRWRLRLGNNKIFGSSGESFASRANAKRAANRLSALIPGSVVIVEDLPKTAPAKKSPPKLKKTTPKKRPSPLDD